jgi:hypothetical protein
MRKIIMSGIILVNVLILMLSGCISFSDNYEENRYYYEIRITVDKSFNYTVYAPFTSENGQSKLIENIESNLKIKEGTGKFEINWTEYGPALKIESNESIYVVSEYMEGGKYHRLSLSMLNETQETVGDNLEENWIFCEGIESGDLEISLKLTCEAGECCGEMKEETTLPEYQIISTKGWQKIITESSLRL